MKEQSNMEENTEKPTVCDRCANALDEIETHEG